MLPEILNIDDPSCKSQLQVEISEWVRIDEAGQTLYHDEWNKIANRLAGSDVPGGFSSLYTQDYAAARNNRTTGKGTQMFVPVNRAHSVRESILGEFIGGKKTLVTTGRNTTDRQLAMVVNKYIQFVLDLNSFEDAIFVPSLDRCIAYGLDWLAAEYEPYGRNFRGSMKLSRVNVRDVLVDCSANAVNGSFFLTDTRRTRRWKMNTDDANRKFAKLYPKHWQPVSSDSNYDTPYVPTDLTMQSIKHTTFYWVDFKHMEEGMVVGMPDTGEIECVTLAEAQKIPQKYWVGPMENEFLYRAHYNRTNGNVFALERLPYTMFPLVPLQNIESDTRRYPLGDITVYDSLFDLINVMATVLIKGLKNSIKGRAYGKTVVTDQKIKDQITKVIEDGGYAPQIEGIFYPSAPVQLISNVLTQLQGWLSDVSSRHPVSEGIVPTQQIAAETVQLLQRKDRASHGRKDVAIRFGLTQYARLLAEMIAIHVTEEDIIEVTDAPPGSSKYVPINKRGLTSTEYKALIADIFDLQLPQPPSDDNPVDPRVYQQQVSQFTQQLTKAQVSFEAENDVKKQPVQGWKLSGEDMTDEQMARTLQGSGMSTDEFEATFTPEDRKIVLYAINILNERKVDLNVRFEVDTDFESDNEYRMNRALMLRKMGLMGGLDLLKELQVPDPEGVKQAADADNQVVQIAQVLAANPDLIGKLRAMIAQQGAQPAVQQ